MIDRKYAGNSNIKEEHIEDQEWLLTYSDMITLLLAFLRC